MAKQACDMVGRSFHLALLTLMLLLWASGVRGTQGYQVDRAVLAVHGAAEPLRISADKDTFGEAIASYLPLRLAREDTLRLEVELEPFTKAPEQALLLLFNTHTGVQHAVTATEREGNRLSFRFVPAEHLTNEPYLIEDTFSTMLIIAGSTKTETPLLWSLHSPPSQRLAHDERATLHVDLCPTPKPRPLGVFEKNFTVCWESRPEFVIQDRSVAPKNWPMLSGVFTLAVCVSGVAWTGLALLRGLVASPASLEASMQGYAVAWQLCLGMALWILFMFFREWNLMRTLWYFSITLPCISVIGFVALRHRHEFIRKSAENSIS
ncbi:hypothetical protein F1559_003173 [Cyanidiococcus yangmingshanensis]|uniref:Dolichyl-diphosphooligosaccharide--protein glycosyltransferase subunit 2 n=1 Tax=Cyanidiococcus yangmingshanensis TaxID=2690220 RepID=A0A7J7IIX8_9RHOD|nr:hypothetical protein F1559_003173 [Cyanidiococcus yangmingshanensis]